MDLFIYLFNKHVIVTLKFIFIILKILRSSEAALNFAVDFNKVV